MKISELKPLEKNPFKSRGDAQIQAIAKSIQEFERMMTIRKIVIDENNEILGGNKRFHSLKKLGYKEIPDDWIEKVEGLTQEQKREFIVKDNSHWNSEWDLELLNEWGVDLADWGVDASFEEFEKEKNEITPPKTDLKEVYQYHIRSFSGFNFISCFKKSKEGIELAKIKEPEYFDRIAFHLSETVKYHVKNTKTCLVCPPSRRHKDYNLAQKLTEYIGEKLRCNYDVNLFQAKNLQKIEPIFKLNKNLDYETYIIIDDIITTGSTIKACVDLLENKNIMVFVAINNKL